MPGYSHQGWKYNLVGKFVHLHASIQLHYPLLSLHIKIILEWTCLGAANGDGSINLWATLIFISCKDSTSSFGSLLAYSGGIAGFSWLVGGSWRPWGDALWCLASAFFDFAGLCLMRVAACCVLAAAAMAHGIDISSFLKSWVVGKLVYTMFISNNRTSFHLW